MAERDGGFSSIDALTGLLVLSVTLAAALGAQTVASRLSAAALEQRQAVALATQLLERAARSSRAVGRQDNGGNGRFVWTVIVVPVADDDAAPARCSIVVDVATRRNARRFKLETVRFCRSEGVADAR